MSTLERNGEILPPAMSAQDAEMARAAQRCIMAALDHSRAASIMLTDDELAVLDTWRFAKRMPSRASAIRELLKRGLMAEGFSSAIAGSKSADFGVTGIPDNDGLDDSEGAEE